jgi:hypothetical protein
MIFTNKATGEVRKIFKQGNAIIILQLDQQVEDGWETLSINEHASELTAQAFLKYLLLWHKDKGYERVDS